MNKALAELTKFVVDAVGEDTVTGQGELAMRKQILNVALSLKHMVVGDSWYTCPAATDKRDGGETSQEDRQGDPCECYVAETQKRILTVLATMYADRPGGRDVLINAGRF